MEVAHDIAGWPDPNERPCDGCGHVWFAGERRHEYLRDAGDDPEDAEVLCVLCVRRRGLGRAGDAERE
jgi:hypothetical protein